MTSCPCSLLLHAFICCYRQVAYLKFEVRVMALNDHIADIHRCLHEMCTTFGTNTKVQFGCLLSTVLSSTKNQHCFVRNKSLEKMCRFTSLALISVRKIYYFNLPSCVARHMAMILGYRTILPGSLARYSGLNDWKQKPHI